MKFLHWLPALTWAGVIYYLSGRTGDDLQGMFPFLDSFNWGHLVAYFVLGAFVYYAFGKTTSTKYRGVLTILICLLYGVSDEFHQSFVPGRAVELFDLMNDGIGASLAVGMMGKLIIKRVESKD